MSRVETASQWVESLMNNSIDMRSNRHTQRGASMPVVLGVIIILVLIALGAWFLIVRPHQAAVSTPKAQSAVAANAASTAAPPPANVASMSAAQLLDEARNAVRAQRWVAPAGNNAFEFYLKVLAKNPNNQVAQDALRESFTTGANAAEQAINANNFDEAQREIDLLAKADSGNYTLTILRSKLDAQHKLSARTEQQATQQTAADVAKQAAAAAAAKKAAEQPQPASPPPEQAEVTPAPPPPPKPVTPAPAPKPKPAGPTRGAQLIHSVKAIPPRIAVQRQRSGYVVVEFTVTVAGGTANVHVVDSQPSRIFDHSAMEAVRKWRFNPALKNGVPVSMVVQQRINFAL